MRNPFISMCGKWWWMLTIVLPFHSWFYFSIDLAYWRRFIYLDIYKPKHGILQAEIIVLICGINLLIKEG